ncbi:MAG: large-conductance mechanosensitive channel protein MscL [Clostridiales Family XIII bacterium]|nr:large-conductance mechanosensitive channel protein MscL [Clostridiales Family XIII bacterium]
MSAADTAKRTKGFIGEFKVFALRGNVMDMAVGVVIGAAFTGIINSLVKDIIMPIIGLFTGNLNFSNFAIKFGEDNSLAYGAFIQAVLNFVLIAFVLFLVIKFFNKLRNEKKDDTPAAPAEIDILTEIRDLLKDK